MENRRIKCWEIQAETGLSRERVICILHGHLLWSKYSARWMPQNFSAFASTAESGVLLLLELMTAVEEKFFRRIVIEDEIWLRNFNPETKQESMGWRHTDSRAFKKFRTQPSAQKVMATIYWDCEGVVMIDDFLKKLQCQASILVG